MPRIEEPTGEGTALAPKGDLRRELAGAFKRAHLTSVAFEELTNVTYGRFRAFVDGGLADFRFDELERTCAALSVDVRAHPRHAPRSEPVAEISDLSQVLDLTKDLQGAFFRGQRCSRWDLLPGAYRDGGPRSRLLPSYDIERYLAQEFRRRAPAILRAVPAPSEHLHWLLYMQHHGVATRLMDWTESALVALYFAVARRDDSDGQLWILDPRALNRLSAIDGPDGSSSEVARGIAAVPFTPAPDSPPADLEVKDRRPPIAIRPPHLFPRMVAQRSTFTIHPDPTAGLELAAALAPGGVGWYRIRSNRKWWLLKQLVEAGISKAYLFPDLDGLAMGLREASCSPPPRDFNLPSIPPNAHRTPEAAS